MLDPLEFAKTKVFAKLLSRCHTKLQMCILAVSSTNNDPGFLEACQSPYTNALPCLSRVPATDSSSIHLHPQHVVHMHTNVRKHTRIALILNETVFFQLARRQRLGDVLRPSAALRTFHNTRLPSIRIFRFQPFSGCACSSSPSRTSALKKACV